MRFEDLEVWKRSARLNADLYKSLADLKDYGFKGPITRAGLSIPSNIAEGNERESPKEFANFLDYAKGSAGELRTQIYTGMEIGDIGWEQGAQWIQEAESLSKMLYVLMKKLQAPSFK